MDSCSGAPRQAGGYDQAFAEAVAAGCLTPAQAFARGSRAAYVERLQTRYALTTGDAERVADNRIQLAELLRDELANAPEPPNHRGPILTVVLLLAVLSVAVVWFVPGRGSLVDAHDTAGVVDGLIFDDAGRVVQVIADSPDGVLERFCTGSERRRCRPLGLVPTTATDVAVRIGVFRGGSGAHGGARALAIRRDSISGRWYAGDGVRPLAGAPAPPGAVELISTR